MSKYDEPAQSDELKETYAEVLDILYRREADLDEPQYDSNSDTISEPFRLTVRAWNLAEACRIAAQTPLHRWEHSCSEEVSGA